MDRIRPLLFLIIIAFAGPLFLSGNSSAFAQGMTATVEQVTVYTEFAELTGDTVDPSEIDPASIAGGVEINEYGVFAAKLKGSGDEVWFDRYEFDFEAQGVDCDEANIQSTGITSDRINVAGVHGAGGSCSD